jgi:hypothetical protein
MYAAAVCPGKKEDTSEFSVAEIPLNTGPVRLTRIAHLTSSVDKDSTSLLDVSLAPDQHTLATSTACFEQDKIARADRAIYLIYLKDPHRKVTKQVVPQGHAPAEE